MHIKFTNILLKTYNRFFRLSHRNPLFAHNKQFMCCITYPIFLCLLSTLLLLYYYCYDWARSLSVRLECRSLALYSKHIYQTMISIPYLTIGYIINQDE